MQGQGRRLRGYQKISPSYCNRLWVFLLPGISTILTSEPSSCKRSKRREGKNSLSALVSCFDAQTAKISQTWSTLMSRRGGTGTLRSFDVYPAARLPRPPPDPGVPILHHLLSPTEAHREVPFPLSQVDRRWLPRRVQLWGRTALVLFRLASWSNCRCENRCDSFALSWNVLEFVK